MLPLLVILASELFIGVPPPLISITSWQPAEQFSWETNEAPPLTEFGKKTRDSRSYAVPASVVGLLLVCNASFPIQWDFVSVKSNGRKVQVEQLVRSTRKAEDIFNNSTFEYISELRLNGEDNTLSGNYTCRSSIEADAETLYSKVYLFWEGNSPPFILRNGENTTVYIEPKRRRNKHDTILPCLVSVPTATVTLEKQINESWVESYIDPQKWSYNPEVGFIAHSVEQQDLLGTYRCSTDSLEQDFALFNVILGPEPPKEEFHEMLLNNASFSYTEENKKFMCCSNSGRRPLLQVIQCENPTICRAIRQSLDTIDKKTVNHGKRVLTYGNSCTSFKVIYQTSGIVKCTGDGVRVYREYFFEETVGIARLIHHHQYKIPLNITGSPYYHWKDANPERMLSVTTASTKVFVGDPIRISCQASTYYFAQGIKWLVSWKNNSQLVEHGTEDVFFLKTALFLHPGYSYLSLHVDSSLTSVACFAPVWNTSEWVNRGIELEVVEPTGPSIDGSAINKEVTVELFWYLNDTGKSLECLIEGNPPPAIHWDHNGKQLEESRHENETSSIRSILLINQINLSTQGVYTCAASNSAGTSKKIFHLYIKEKMSSAEIFGIILMVTAAILFFVLFGFLVRHVRSQSNSIKHLKTVAFKDVIERDRQRTSDDDDRNNDAPHMNFPFPSPSSAISVTDLESISNSHSTVNERDRHFPKFNLPQAVNHAAGYEKF